MPNENSSAPLKTAKSEIHLPTLDEVSRACDEYLTNNSAPQPQTVAAQAPAAVAVPDERATRQIADAITNNFREAGWSMPSIDEARVLEAVTASVRAHGTTEPLTVLAPDVDSMARVLLAAFAKAEPEHPITQYPTSFWATFADMARAALAATPTADATDLRAKIMSTPLEIFGTGIGDIGIAYRAGHRAALLTAADLVTSTVATPAAAAPVVLPEPDGAANLPYFSYDSDSGVEFHATKEEAISWCEEALRHYREESPDGWPDEVESIKWGLVLGRSEQCDVKPVEDHPDFTETCDYLLKPYALLATGGQAQAVEPSDSELIALNAGERFFSESPSKYPEAGHGTQYHAGAPGIVDFARAALALRADPAAHSQKFQQRVQPWMTACFGPEISADSIERNHRFLEEALELVQACGCTASEAHQLVDYVFGRPVGDKQQEVGGVMVTLAALCLAQGLDMHAAGEVELARIWTKVEAIRAKQAAKPKHSPLPMHAPQAQADARDAERYRALRDERNQLHEDDISVSDSSFNTYFGDELDKASDALIARNAAIAAAKGE